MTLEDALPRLPLLDITDTLLFVFAVEASNDYYHSRRLSVTVHVRVSRIMFDWLDWL